MDKSVVQAVSSRNVAREERDTQNCLVVTDLFGGVFFVSTVADDDVRALASEA